MLMFVQARHSSSTTFLRLRPRQQQLQWNIMEKSLQLHRSRRTKDASTLLVNTVLELRAGSMNVDETTDDDEPSEQNGNVDPPNDDNSNNIDVDDDDDEDEEVKAIIKSLFDTASGTNPTDTSSHITPSPTSTATSSTTILTSSSSSKDPAEHPLDSIMSPEPISISVHTQVGNKLLDYSLELTAQRSRDIAMLKKSISRSLPGRPPEQLIRLRFQGRLLHDEVLVDELLTEVEQDEDDDDEGEDNDEHGAKLTLLLDMVPPVDPKFATSTQAWTQAPLTELLEAYTINAAAMYANAKYLLQDNHEQHDKIDGDDDDVVDDLYHPDSDTSVTELLQQQARLLRKDLEAGFPEKVKVLLSENNNNNNNKNKTQEGVVVEGDGTTNNSTTLTAAPGSDAFGHATMIQRRGQRYRVPGGARTNLKRALQLNLNLNWQDTLRNVCLFLFFGFFGGRSIWSKYLLIMGAPMSIVIQARPIKFLIKQAFYSMAHPPSVLLSLLPAPQQAILNYNAQTALQALYPTATAAAAAATTTTPSQQAGAKTTLEADDDDQLFDDDDEDDDENDEVDVDEDDE